MASWESTLNRLLMAGALRGVRAHAMPLYGQSPSLVDPTDDGGARWTGCVVRQSNRPPWVALLASCSDAHCRIEASGSFAASA